MRSAKATGRVVGLLLFLQLAAGLVVAFVLLGPLATARVFPTNAAGSSSRISVAALLWFATGALAVGIAITAWPVFRPHGRAMALWLLALSVVTVPLCAVENGTLLSMLSLSQRYAQASAADADLLEALGAALRSAQKWAHYSYALIGSSVFCTLYGILVRSALSPRPLAALGLVAAVLHLGSVTMPFFGLRSALVLQLPLALSNLVVAVWLMAKGFAERPRLSRTQARAGTALQEV